MAADSTTNADQTGQPETRRSAWRRWIAPDLGQGNWKQRIRRLLIRLGLWYLVIVVAIVLLQRKLIYFPERSDRLLASETRLAKGTVHDISIKTDDGLTLHGWHFLPRGKTATNAAECDDHLKSAKWVVLYFHGNAGNRKNREFDCRMFTQHGADVFHFDYRGYGENPGSPSESKLIDDAKVLWNYAVNDRKIPASKIIVFGESLGGGVATQLAAAMCTADSPPAGLVLLGTFSSLTDTGAYHYPWLPVRWMLRDRFDSASVAKQVTCPVLQFHGARDDIVPIAIGRNLHKAFPDQSQNGIPKLWLEVQHAGHNDMPEHLLSNAIETFLSKL